MNCGPVVNAFLRSFFPGYVCAREHMLQEGLVKDWMACCASRKLKLCRNNLKEVEMHFLDFFDFCPRSWCNVTRSGTRSGSVQGSSMHPRRKWCDQAILVVDCIPFFHCIVHSTLVSWPFTTVLHVLSEVFSRWRSSGRISWCISSTLQAWCHEGRC